MLVYGIMVLTIFVLPFFSAEGYSLFRHTTSQLGAQNTQYAFVMNFVFALLGLFTIYGSLKKFSKNVLLLLLACIFGFSLVLTSIFSHAPISHMVPYNRLEDSLHSLSSTLTGFSFTLFTILYAVSQKAYKRTVATIVATLIIIFTVLIFYLPELAGIWQRLIFMISFAWLFNNF